MKRYTIVFICALLVSSMVVAGTGIALQRMVLEPLGIQREEHPVALPFVLMADEVLQFQVRRGWEKGWGNGRDSAAVEDSGEAAEVTPTPVPTPAYQAVDESWFDDVLFIGDSRTYGLRGLGRLGKADYFCSEGLTVYGAMKTWISDRNFSATTLEKLLQSKSYGKIYIHMGLNELSYGAEVVMEGYHELIALIRQYQPDAVIVIQECMTISEKMGEGKRAPIEEFRKLNTMLRELAASDPVGYRFSETNSWAGDENGYLRKEIASGDCHLLGKYYTEWGQFILEDAGWYGIP